MIFITPTKKRFVVGEDPIFTAVQLGEGSFWQQLCGEQILDRHVWEATEYLQKHDEKGTVYTSRPDVIAAAKKLGWVPEPIE